MDIRKLGIYSGSCINLVYILGHVYGEGNLVFRVMFMGEGKSVYILGYVYGEETWYILVIYVSDIIICQFL